MNDLQTAIFLVAVTYAIIDHLYKPIRDLIPVNFKPFTFYVTVLLAAIMVFLSGINLFAGIFRSPVVGQILTAVLCGCGSELVDNLFGVTKLTTHWLKSQKDADIVCGCTEHGDKVYPVDL